MPTFAAGDILFVTRSVGYVSVADSDGNPEVWRTIDGGYSWHKLPDKGGSLPSDITAFGKLAGCKHNRIMTAGKRTLGTMVEFSE
jgi:hypothetical protein